MPDLTTRRRCLALIAAAASLPYPIAASTAGEAATLIERAARQGLHAARLVRASFFAALEIDSERHFQMLAKARRDYADGPDLNDAEAAQVWAALDPYIAQAVDTNTLPDLTVSAVAAGATTLIASVDQAVARAVEDAAGTDAGQARALHLACWLRTRMQVLAAQAAAGTLGAGDAPGALPLRDAIAEVDGRLTTLTTGDADAGIPSPDPRQLVIVADLDPLWQDFQRVLRPIGDIGIASAFELNAVAAQVDPLTDAMNKLVHAQVHG